MPQFAQLHEARAKLLPRRIVGEIVEARVFPERVGVGRDAVLHAPQAAERGKMLIGDAVSRERSGEDVAVELRVRARAWNGSYVDDEPHLRGVEQRDEILGRTGRVSDCEEGIAH